MMHNECKGDEMYAERFGWQGDTALTLLGEQGDQVKGGIPLG